MERIEIYSSKKKSMLLLMGSLLFVVGGFYMLMNAENFTGYRARSPFLIKTIGIASVLFFGLGIYVSIKQLITNQLVTNQLILIIDRKVVNVNPKKSQTEFIEWKNINGFSELKIQSQKFVIIDVDNSDYWIEKGESGIRKKLMKFNVNNYGSPFNLSANSMQMNYAELMKTLNENLNKYKYNG
ncbi:STM3941 family protein [Chryseobacterium balustinum]|uniref:Uncharacterized protein n=1 Tax=Chryseobacterium balustinum TaxID=246 RepID=A0AAX2IIY9_9FLAO|nr:STM3941 family protein [Chryseobacterium balustinum]AZB29960.1 hypothetical protein EB354_12245 [Chryseobacterium balustinum]SKC13648.1 hypothetical protein SAMN05421800_1483 [Chryseobacterium balustinum]SQA88754.1 Uncharacterised protein [Chryseobacterium balustinum]